MISILLLLLLAKCTSCPPRYSPPLAKIVLWFMTLCCCMGFADLLQGIPIRSLESILDQFEDHLLLSGFGSCFAPVLVPCCILCLSSRIFIVLLTCVVLSCSAEDVNFSADGSLATSLGSYHASLLTLQLIMEVFLLITPP